MSASGSKKQARNSVYHSADVASRALGSVSQWLERHPEGEILFVCHDAVMQSMAQRLTGKFFKNGHGRPFRFMRLGDAWSVVEVG